ncbi:MAG: hypothetical protein WCK59_00695 [Candidatus Falkowbacteria bacterium]
MRKSLEFSLIATVITAAIYLTTFIFLNGIPLINKGFLFANLSTTLKISRVHDLIVLFPFFMAISFLVFQLKRIEDKDIKQYRLIGWGLVSSLIIGSLFTIEIGLVYGLIISLSLCFFFGLITGLDFAIISGLAFGLMIWIITAIDSGLLLGSLPAITVGLIFAATAGFGFGIKKILSPKR